MSAKGSEYQAESTFENLSMEVSRERVENLWRQVMTNRSSSRSDLATARAARAQAEMEKQRVSNETMEATQRACDDIISDAEREVAKAKDSKVDATALKTAAQEEMKKAETVRAEADEHWQKMKVEAETYAEKVKAEAQQEAHRMREDSRNATLTECSELKRHVTNEVQAILAEIDSIRAAAEEELETQRIYTETANLGNVNVRADVMSRMGASGNGNGNEHSTNGHSEEMWEMAAVATGEDMANGQPDMGPAPDDMTNSGDSRTNKKAK